MNCSTAKKIDLVSYLSKQGHKSIKTTSREAWFLSPFRNEKNASFKVNTTNNVWYDFGEGIGGTIIDLVMLLEKCSINDALIKLSNDSFSFQLQPKSINVEKKVKYSINKITELTNKHLLDYLKNRKINIEFAKLFCVQVHYTFDLKKEFYAIGFKNDLGGFELRNSFSKICLNKKSITTIYTNSKTISLFESWSDFLSYLTLKNKIPDEDFLILNSTALVNKSVSVIKKYDQVKSFFDNDEAGNKAYNYIKNSIQNEVFDYRKFYSEYDDLNDYLVNR